MMSKFGSNALRRRPATRKGARSLVLAVAALAVGAAPAGAHGGDTTLVHSCIGGDGNVKIIAPGATCAKNELPLDWSSGDTNTTYTAGAGLSLSSDNVFSVSEVPWTALSDIPPDFADGVDNVGASIDMKSNDANAPKQPNDNDGFVHWNNLEGVPSAIADGDLPQDDGEPNQAGDPVSFSKIKDLMTMFGDGRITGSFVRDGSIASQDIGDGTITARDLAGSDAAEAVVPGAVTSEKILDGTIQARDLASGLISQVVETVEVDPGPVEAGQRTHVTVAAAVALGDLVTVSPPHDLETGLVFAGSAVRADGAVTIYLHNASLGPIDGDRHVWTVQRIRVP